MKLLNLNPTKRAVLATTAVLAAGLLSLLPWRLAAQPSSETPPAGDMPSRGRVGGPGGGGFGRGMAPSARPPTTPPTNVAPARFEATIYEMPVPENRIAELDAVKLEAAAATSQSLAKALAQFGTAKILYKVDQTVNLYGENITLGTQEPMVAGTSRGRDGDAIHSISYTSVGLITQISATPHDGSKPTDLEVQLNFQLSALGSSGVEISTGVPATRIRNVALSQSGTPKFGKPSVLVTVSAAGASEKAPPVAYIVRYVFTQPKP